MRCGCRLSEMVNDTAKKLIAGLVALLMLIGGAFLLKGKEPVFVAVGVDICGDVVSDNSSIEYGPAYEKHNLENGIHQISLYSGVRFGIENCTWKKIEVMKSLKGTGIEPVIVSDGINDVKVIDWNYTSITVELSKKSGFGKATELKVFTTKEDGSKIFSINQSKSFSNSLSKTELVLPFSFDSTLEFGDSSTTVMLQGLENDTMDNTVDSSAPTSNYGTDAVLYVGNYTSSTYRTYIQFNTSVVPSGATINDMQLTFKAIINDCSGTTLMAAHRVYDWNDSTVFARLNETNMTWNNQPCGTAFDNSTNCNLTSLGTKNSPCSAALWFNFSVLAGGFRNTNMSYVVKKSTEAGLAIYYQGFASKEHGTVASRPYLNITYTEVSGTPDTNITIWNGTAYTNYNSTTGNSSLNFSRCRAPSTYCEPRNQNASIGRSAFNISNNGTLSATTLVGWLNETKTWINMSCSCYNVSATSIQLGATATVLNSSATAVGSYRDIYCWVNISATPGWNRGWRALFNYTS